MARYGDMKNLRWVQEEPANMGAWSFLRPELEQLPGTVPSYIGRAPAAAPATGSHRQHKIEQDALVSAAFAP
jgi:2-oxoglutarate dehydrogenase E1 component